MTAATRSSPVANADTTIGTSGKSNKRSRTEAALEDENIDPQSSTSHIHASWCELKTKYSYLAPLFEEFESNVLSNSEDAQRLVPFSSNKEWFWYYECQILFKALTQTALVELAHSSTLVDHAKTTTYETSSSSSSNNLKTTLSIRNRTELAQRYQALRQFYRLFRAHGASRLERQHSLRIFRLGRIYGLTKHELELFHLLVIFQGSQSQAFRCQLQEEDAMRRQTMAVRLAEMSEIDFEDFFNDEREYMKEGIALVDDESYSNNHNLRLSNIAVRVLLGRTLSSNQLLKVSQTALETILVEDRVMSKPCVEGDPKAGLSIENNHDAEDFTIFTSRDITKTKTTEKTNNLISESSSRSRIPEEKGLAEEKLSSLPDSGSSSSLQPYPDQNQLEYLEDRFQVVAFAIRASNARVKDQMKEAGTKQPWEQSTGTSTAYKTPGRRELKAKQRLHRQKVRQRLQLTMGSGVQPQQAQLPRLEEMSAKFHLDEFEQNVIVMLIGKTISPVISNLLDSADTSSVQRMDESITVNQILNVFCDTFCEQVQHRTYFYKSSKLLVKGLIKLNRARWHCTSGDLVDQRVELDRRVLDWVVGLDTEINELVEGSDLYTPQIDFDQVVLPRGYKNTLIKTIQGYIHFQAYLRQQKLAIAAEAAVVSTSTAADNADHDPLPKKKTTQTPFLTYGHGLVILLTGQSGTGKTLTVNAIAHQFQKRVLLVDFPSLQGKQSQHQGQDADADLRGLFREAEMNNAILFFDECESIFKQRQFGGDRILNALLVELERFEGIVFLATNRPFDLDEAMHRRITQVFEFYPPDHLQRAEIWNVLTSNQSMFCMAPDIDWETLSYKYELSGGFIKNALLSALLEALQRQPTKPVITEADLVHGCQLQIRGALHMKTFDQRVIPDSGFDHLFVAKETLEQLTEIVQFEKARHMIYRQWGFGTLNAVAQGKLQSSGEEPPSQPPPTPTLMKGLATLFYGPYGTEKLQAAKAIGFELGRPLKVVHLSQVFGAQRTLNLAKGTSPLESVFDDAKLMDAVLVLEGLEVLRSVSSSSEEEEGPDKMDLLHLVSLIDRFTGVVILVATTPPTRSSSVEWHGNLTRRLQSIVAFELPRANLRLRIWNAVFPAKAPREDSSHSSSGHTWDFKNLADRFGFTRQNIANVIFTAAAKASSREDKAKRVIRMQDVVDAAEAEKKKMEGGQDRTIMNQLFA